MKGFAMEGTRRRGATNDVPGHGPLRFSRSLGVSVAVEGIEDAPARRLLRLRGGQS